MDTNEKLKNEEISGSMLQTCPEVVPLAARHPVPLTHTYSTSVKATLNFCENDVKRLQFFFLSKLSGKADSFKVCFSHFASSRRQCEYVDPSTKLGF